MSIPSEELAELVARTTVGALPRERAHLETVINTITRSNIYATTASSRSRFLRNLLDNHPHFFERERFTFIKSADLYGVDLPVMNAFPLPRNGRRQVVVFNGLLQLIRHFAELITVLHHLQAQRASATIFTGGEARSESEAFALAGFAILADFVQSGGTPAPFGDILGRTSKKNAAIGYLGAVLFILAHECGHLYLGHTEAHPTLSERLAPSFALDEILNSEQESELHADRFAYLSLQPDVRDSFFPSILFFLGPFAFLEAFALPSGGSHPLSVNRAANLARLMANGSDAASAAGHIIESQVAGIRRLAAQRTAEGDLRGNILQNMPVDCATAVIAEIKARIRSEMGFLEEA